MAPRSFILLWKTSLADYVTPRVSSSREAEIFAMIESRSRLNSTFGQVSLRHYSVFSFRKRAREHNA